MPKHLITLATLCAVLLAGCAHMNWGYAYSEQLEAQSSSVVGIGRVHVEGKAGSLNIEMVPGSTAAQVSGDAMTSHKENLAQLEILVEQRGDVLHIAAVVPDDLNGNNGIDIVIELPEGLHVTVLDGSGSLSISGVAGVDVTDGSGSMSLSQIAGNVRVVDGSGSIDIHEVAGDVWLTDGSGSMDIEHVDGSVIVETDGSGSMSIGSVAGDVTVKDDGSGSISVHEVRGAFAVHHDGSGSISYSGVDGEVSVPNS